MNREIKFRVWATLKEKMVYQSHENVTINLYGDQSCSFFFEENYIGGGHNDYLMQYTGLKDKNGKEIYEGDILRGKLQVGREEENWFSEAYYRVNTLDYEGFSITAVGMTSDAPDNQHPIVMNPSFKNGRLNRDYRNKNYGSVAFDETYSSGRYASNWKENHYSNDIEVIGNIYEHPNLLQL